MTISYSLFKSKFKKSIADAVYNEIVSKTSRYYHFLGKENAWTDFLSPFIPSSPTDVPGPPSDNFRYELHVRRDILTTKLITPADVSFIAPRYDWESGMVYDMYDDAITADDPAPSGAVRLEEARFYVLTTDYNVYKCISNDYNSPSTVMPTGTSTSVFSTIDGYLWKFMYTIPISLRTRFLSSDYIPVTTSLKSQFYNAGEITQITIDNGGSDYIVETTGGGNISSSTSSATVTGVGTNFSTSLTAGYFLKKLNGDIIGTVLSIQSNTSLTLSANAAYTTSNVSYKILPDEVATATISGNGYLEDNKDYFTNITITNAGAGYASAPTVTVSDPTIISGNEVLATVEVTLDGDSIDVATITEMGYGYTKEELTLTVAPPVSGATTWQTNTTYSLNAKIVRNGNYYNVTSPGVSASIPPTHTTGTALNGTATLAYVGTIAVLTPVTTKSNAAISLIVTNGEITGVVIDNGGVGYTTANITITDANHPTTDTPDETYAVLTPNLFTGNIDTLQANVELLAIPGSIEVIKMVEGGSGYSFATVEVIGDGTGCTATATITGGRVSAINILTGGYGYTWTDIVISGNGTGAIARAIMSPLKGHGKDAIDELNANSIAFYSSFTKDINQGLVNTNDYRKVGLLRNITRFGSSQRFTDDVGSGCVLITGVFDINHLDYDMLLVQLKF